MVATALILIVLCVVLLVSQLATEGIVKPYVEYRKVLAEISYTLIYYAPLIVSASAYSKRDEQTEIAEKLRQLSARLRSAITALPFYDLTRLLQLVPQQERIYDAAGRLVRMSNMLLETDQKRYDEIRQDMAGIGTLLQIDVAREK